MSAFNYDDIFISPTRGFGPAGPFPQVALVDGLERRWLHYAFLSHDGRHSFVANAAWLGPTDDEARNSSRFTTILLLHERGLPWTSSQFNADISRPPWSAFLLPYSNSANDPLTIRSVAGEPAVDMRLRRTSRPCTSQCAFFAGSHHLRWQSESGVRAQGVWRLHNRAVDFDGVGYHERVRGRWGWPELDEWVFGFANDLKSDPDKPPRFAGVFTFIKPRSPEDSATASFMLWKGGVMRRHFPRRRVSFAVQGTLERNRVQTVPPLSQLLGVKPMASVPKRLVISARMGDDWAILDFEAEAAARVCIPSETSLQPFSVHEVIGPCLFAGISNGERFEIETRGIVEFSGGAGGD
jgi:hypothetical protein